MCTMYVANVLVMCVCFVYYVCISFKGVVNDEQEVTNHDERRCG